MKKVLSLILALTMAVSLSACGGKDKDVSQAKTTTAKTTESKSDNAIEPQSQKTKSTVTLEEANEIAADLCEGIADIYAKYWDDSGYCTKIIVHNGEALVDLADYYANRNERCPTDDEFIAMMLAVKPNLADSSFIITLEWQPYIIASRRSGCSIANLWWAESMTSDIVGYSNADYFWVKDKKPYFENNQIKGNTLEEIKVNIEASGFLTAANNADKSELQADDYGYSMALEELEELLDDANDNADDIQWGLYQALLPGANQYWFEDDDGMLVYDGQDVTISRAYDWSEKRFPNEDEFIGMVLGETKDYGIDVKVEETAFIIVMTKIDYDFCVDVWWAESMTSEIVGHSWRNGLQAFKEIKGDTLEEIKANIIASGVLKPIKI